MSLRRITLALAFGLAAVGCGGSSADVADDSPSVLTTMVAPDATVAPVTTGEVADTSVVVADTSAVAAESGYQPFSDLPLISVEDLPPEAIDTLVLIDDGGPYPYRQDGSVFQNRERLLPERDRGHYLEFTVETPGSDDRGARRIVAGDDGERYWTDDHYDSFSEISDWEGAP